MNREIHNFFKNFHKKLFIYYLLSSLIIITVIFTLRFFHSKSDFIKEQELLHSVVMSELDSYMKSSKNISKQIASRTTIRNNLFKYNHNKISLQELQISTDKLLSPAIHNSETLTQIIRTDITGRVISNIGLKESDMIEVERLFNSHNSTHIPDKVHLHSLQLIDKKLRIILHSPIILNGELLGWDYVVFKTEPILESINWFESESQQKGFLAFIVNDLVIPITDKDFIDIPISIVKTIEDKKINITHIDDIKLTVSKTVMENLLFITYSDKLLVIKSVASQMIIYGSILMLILIVLLYLNSKLIKPVLKQWLKLARREDIVKNELREAYNLFNSGNIAVIKWKNDENWTIEYISDSCNNIFGYSTEEFYLNSIKYNNIILKQDLARVNDEVAYNSNIADKKSFQHKSYRVVKKDGTIIWVSDNTRIIRSSNGDITHYIGYIMDITESVKKEDLLKEATERFNIAMETTQDGLWDWDINSDRVYYSKMWKSMLGYQEDEIGDSVSEWRDRVHKDDLENVLNSIKKHLNKESIYFINEHRIATKSGDYKWILDRGKAIFDKSGKPYRMIGFHTDITSHKQLQENLKQISVTDSLTGLLNRKGLEMEFELFRKSAKRHNRKTAILYIDLDGFKSVNDTYGHSAGDKVLERVADILRTETRGDELITRMGGDEFVLFVPEYREVKELEILAKRLLKSIQKPIRINEYSVNVGMSIGIAVTDIDKDFNEAIKIADNLMYKVKDGGKNSYMISK